MAIAHVIRTSVWTIQNGSAIDVPFGGGDTYITIVETGDSGPFTVSNISDPTIASTGTLQPTDDHLLPVHFTGTAGSVTITVTDKSGRTQTQSFTIGTMAAAAHKHPSTLCVRGHRLDHLHERC
jgi:hypothetical protein